MIWDGSPEELESWIDKVLRGKTEVNAELVIKDSEIE